MVNRIVVGELRTQIVALLIAIDNEFIPVLNEEHSGYCWTAFECWPKNLHMGLKNTLNNKSIKGKLQTILDLIT